MAKQEVSPLSKKLTILIGLGVVGAMAFGLSISFYRNLLFEETLENLSNRNRTLRAQIDDGLQELAYYRSLQYRDKYAKENLGRVNPGEKVLIITETEEPLPELVVQDESFFAERDAAYHEYLRKLPVIEHWKMYLFDPEGLQKLKQSF